MINAIILAAGKGTRLGDLTLTKPKCLLEISKGFTILDSQLKSLLGTKKIDSITIVVGYRHEDIITHVKLNYIGAPIKFCLNNDYQVSNTAQSLLYGLQSLHTEVTNVIQLNGDVVCSQVVIPSLLNQDQELSFASVKRHKLRDEEMKVFLKDSSNQILSISKEIMPNIAIGEAFGINFFANSFIKKMISALKKVYSKDSQSYFEAALNEVISNSLEKLYMHDIGKEFALEIDYVADLNEARAHSCSINGK